jgi:hypothetical protein
VIPSDFSFGYLSAERKSPVKIPSPLWVSRQLGHSSPEHTLRRYIHLLPQEEVDLSFAEISVPKRPYTALPHSSKSPNKNTPDLSGRGRYEIMERETGLEPATLSLRNRSKGKP